jgi:Flp pilus assembly pilin Flp
MLLMWIQNFRVALNEKLSEEHAQGMVEYAIIIAVVAVISVAVFMGDGGSGGKAFEAVNGLYDQANDAVTQIEVQNLDVRN